MVKYAVVHIETKKIIESYDSYIKAKNEGKNWSSSSQKYDVLPVFDNLQPGYKLTYLDLERIKSQLVFKTYSDPGTFNPYDKTNTLGDRIKTLFRKYNEELVTGIGDYIVSIKPVQKNELIIIAEKYDQDKKENITVGILGRVVGVRGTKGTMRAKREVDYLAGELAVLEDRILSGTFPVITPEGITTQYEVRPEAPLIPEPLQVIEPVTPELVEDKILMLPAAASVLLLPAARVPFRPVIIAEEIVRSDKVPGNLGPLRLIAMYDLVIKTCQVRPMVGA